MAVDDERPGWIPETDVTELAESGALCLSCGGICLPDVDTAVLTLSAARSADVELPFCSCEGCLTCRSFRQAVNRLATAAGGDTSHTDAMNADSHATLPISQEIDQVPQYEALGALRQEITAAQREIEGFSPRLLSARQRGDGKYWRQLFREREELKDRLAALQASL